jgi:hypothetical protein
MRTRPRTPVQIRIAAAAILLVTAGWWVADRHDRTTNEHRLAAIASQIAGRDVKVHCPGPIGRVFSYDIVEGSVRFDAGGSPADETKLRKEACAELDALAEGRRAAQLACAERSPSCGDDAQRVAGAVDVITHESFHLNGIADEGLAECNSLQTMAWTATQLGATQEQGRALARLNFETGYPQMPDQYRASGCADGGPLALHPQDPQFP